MEKLGMLYQGKAKKLYETDNPDVLWVEYTDQATAGNGAKKENIAGKAHLNNQITAVVFNLLARRGIPSHFIRRISDTEQLNRHMTMFPLEIVMRNKAAGSFAERYGVEEGTALKQPVLEFFYKSDALNDPFINREDIPRGSSSWPTKSPPTPAACGRPGTGMGASPTWTRTSSAGTWEASFLPIRPFWTV